MFVSKAVADHRVKHLSNAPLWGRLLSLPTKREREREVGESCKGQTLNRKLPTKSFITLDHGLFVTELFTSAIYEFKICE
jgi:hypothetical protein